MIATMTMQSSRMVQTQDRRFSPSANSAGSPLPLIPRRTSSSRPTMSTSPSMPLPVRASMSNSSLSSYSSSSSSSTITTVAQPTNDSALSSSSSSSDGSRPTIRTRRVRGVRGNDVVCPPELSTPVPTLTIVSSPSQQHVFPSKNSQSAPQPAQSKPLLYTPGMSLRATNSTSRNVSESNHVSRSKEAAALQSGSQSASALCETFEEARMVRKKSGQVVKSSLKSSRSVSRSGSLSVVTTPSMSKSEPTTPTSKAVHFDSKLEHVKLFLAEQKPLAVSRDGSPTDDTSGTDSDFPRFIFGTDQAGDGDSVRRLPKKKLIMQVANMPARLSPCMDDVALEEMCLAPDGTSILGNVRVRNLAFMKWIAVRFTFDSWQTTSEVTGKYLDSPSPECDRFSFAIRLNDLLARIEGKTLLLAVKYSIEGREMWDNNGGQNYLVTFAKAKVDEPLPVKRSTTLSDDEASTDMKDLRKKLEKVVNPKDRTGPAFNSQQVPSSSASWTNSNRGSYQHSASPDPDATAFRTSSSFASRYDFAASLKRPWNPDAHIHGVHNRTQSFPLSSTSSSIPWPQKSSSNPYAFRRTPAKQYVPNTLGSPRDLSEDALQVQSPRPLLPSESSSMVQMQQQPMRGRHHQRGYFDLDLPPPSSLKRTPPGTPRSPFSPLERGLPVSTSSARFNSFPPMEPSTRRIGIRATPDSTDSSELSTPSMITPSSSRESTPSPSPIEFFEDPNMSPETHYRHFLNKFCFFTGPESTFEDTDELPRTHSASDIEEFLSGLPSMQSIEGNSELQYSQSRSSSVDDIALNRSGSLTPTISRLGLSQPAITVTMVTPPTPVLL